MRALVLEDDVRLRSLVVRTLTRAGLACDEASRLEEAEEFLDLHAYDLLVLDRRLPDGDGLDICRSARKKGFANSILVLTARDDPESTVEGLSEGADDYLGKPFDLSVLAARARALLRRNERRPPEELRCGNLRLDPVRREVMIAERQIELTPKEFDLLRLFAGNPGRVFPRKYLLEKIWDYSYEGYDRTIDSHINRLRAKIEENPDNPQLVLTVWGIGYKFTDAE